MDKRIALDEFLNNHQNKDIIKARVVIDYLMELEPDERRRILFEFFKLDDDFAIPVLAYLNYKHPSLVQENPQIRDSLLEKSIGNPGQLLKNLIVLKPETVVLVEVVEKIRLREALPRLRQFLHLSDDIQLLEKTIRTLGSFADTNAIDIIGEFLTTENSNLKSTAIQALADIGSKKSLSILFSVLEKSPDLKETILSLFKELQNEPAIHFLNQTLTSTNADIRLLGKSKLVELGIKTIPVLTANLQVNHADLQIHTLNILQEIGDQSAVKAVRNLLNTEPEDDNVRFAAYETLAHLPSLKGDYLLATGLSDRDDGIRLAAAKAIDKNLDPVLVGGIKNMVKNENAESVRIIKAIIDAEAGELFHQLLEVPYFKQIGVEYIASRVHSDVRNYYLDVLRKYHRSDLLEEIEQKASTTSSEATRPVICAVDDSAMILSIYRSILNELGFEPILFEYPEECLLWLADHKPVAVFTDLNMPKISGIELSRHIREKYDAATLPLIMATTQQDGKDENELKSIGIDRVINKPFDVNTIQNLLTELSIKGVTIK